MKKQKAFTLAEVLITLGIIGVLAAITIPPLMQNIQDRQFKEAAKEAFSKASQAVQQMKVDEGGSLSYYYGNNASFGPVFVKYFKYLSGCGGYCMVPYSMTNGSGGMNNYNYKNLLGDPTDTWILGSYQFLTPDGMFWGISNNTTGHIIISVDVNGYQKAPNIFGRDVFCFELLNDNLIPLGPSGTYITPTASNCNRTSHHNQQGYTCMEYVMEGKDY